MARNAEKALNLYNRWQSFKNEAHISSETLSRRPKLASQCNTLLDADRFRRELVQESSKKILAIKNPSLSEYQIRTLNDEINKLIRTLHHWNIRVRELGGNDYIKRKSSLDIEGRYLPGNKAYKYYGVAQDLPGVKELFDEIEENKKYSNDLKNNNKRKRNLNELLKNIDSTYYGSQEDEDGDDIEQLLKLEAAKEQVLIRQSQSEFTRKLIQQEEDIRNGNSNSSKKGMIASHLLTYIEDDGKADEEVIDLGQVMKEYEPTNNNNNNNNSSGSTNSSSTNGSSINSSSTNGSNVALSQKKKELLDKYL